MTRKTPRPLYPEGAPASTGSRVKLEKTISGIPSRSRSPTIGVDIT
jgi:hypothetical protein